VHTCLAVTGHDDGAFVLGKVDDADVREREWLAELANDLRLAGSIGHVPSWVRLGLSRPLGQ
jgi:hypothetical protein